MPYGKEWVEKNVASERIAMNMINSFLGRMHLASHLELLSEEQLALVKEGVDYYKKLTEAKKKAIPCFPNGFCRFGDESVASGFTADGKTYLAVWGLKSDLVKIGVSCKKEKIKIAYPLSSKSDINIYDGCFAVKFPSYPQAVFLEIEK
jgi:alpha-galactosidase